MTSHARFVEPVAEAAFEALVRPLRFLTCGSVDDGKSTLIGRLLWDTKAVKQDLAQNLTEESGPAQNDLGLPDFALLLDGLQAEREQGITIDVAYRYFSSKRRSFIVADTPGHEQYTRNMATGASTADVAVLLVDARKGLQEQTRRHAAIVALMGIRHLILAVNKIDLTGYDRAGFETIEKSFRGLASRHGINDVVAIPVSALKGENIVHRSSQAMPWYAGPTLVEALDAAPALDRAHTAFRFPVQRVVRPHEGIRGFQGTIAAGTIAVGDPVEILPRGLPARISEILTFDGKLASAVAGDAVTLTLDRHIDIARGDMIAASIDAPMLDQAFAAQLIVLNDRGLDANRDFWLKASGRCQRVRVSAETVLDLASGEWQPAIHLSVNMIASVALSFDDQAIFDRYAENRVTGAFILIDPDSNETIAAGMITGTVGKSNSLYSAEHEERVVISLPARFAEKLLADEAFSGYRKHARILHPAGKAVVDGHHLPA